MDALFQLLDSLLQLVVALWGTVYALIVLVLQYVPLIAWVAFWLLAVNWVKFRQVLASGGWIGLVLIGFVMVLIWGLPGFGQTAAVAVKWVLGLLLVLHIITNNQRLVRALQDGSSRPEVDAKRSRIKAAMAAGTARAEE